jgi:hypothetical protein
MSLNPNIIFVHYGYFALHIELLPCNVIMVILSLQEEFQLAIFKNKKKENIFANRVLYRSYTLLITNEAIIVLFRIPKCTV